jgi:hypothetical protein
MLMKPEIVAVSQRYARRERMVGILRDVAVRPDNEQGADMRQFVQPAAQPVLIFRVVVLKSEGPVSP